MPLSKSSVLHYWSSRYGINPRIGGRPVFTRNSAGLFTTQEGEVDSAIINTPRFDWATLNLPNGLTERRKVLTLELARTNNILFASDFSNAAWTKSVMSVVTGVADPAGGTSACTLTATAASGFASQNLSAGSSLARTNSLYLRRRTGVGPVQIQTPDGANIAVALTSTWQRFSVTGGASTTRGYAVIVTTGGDAVDAWLAQMDDGPFPTAGIQTTSAAATRAADSCYWNFPPVPQAMMLYVRFVEQGTNALSANSRILFIGSAANGTPQYAIDSQGGFYDTGHNNGVGGVSSTLAVAPATGDTVELLSILFADGSIQTIQSINGAAVTSSAQSVALALAAGWSDTRLWLNSSGVNFVGCTKFAEVRVVKYADVVGVTAADRMAELRGFELGPNGDIL